MHSLLERIFKKRGIEDATKLDDEEKKVFDNWQAILSKDELTVEDIKMFCKTQLEIIDGKWMDLNLPNDKKAELIPYHTVYKSLLGAIDSPKSAKEALEKYLITLTK